MSTEERQGSHVFTAILCTYNRPTLMKEAVAALRRQTYQNMEIILINNGGTPETIEHLNDVAASDSRVKLVNFEENVYSDDDPAKYVDVCFNAALEIATGDYVWCQSDDDFLADDYAERMVTLFIDNPECTSAAGLPVSVDVNSELNDTGPRDTNFRPRYMPGHLLAIDHVRGKSTMFGAPGYVFTVKREELIKAGGFRQPIEYAHMYGIVPFGVTGFDEEAIAYWRHHDGQLNKDATNRGLIGAYETFKLFKDWQIGRRWQVLGGDMGGQLVAAMEREQCLKAANWITMYLYSGQLSAALYLTRTMWRHPQFWVRTPAKAVRRAFSITPIRLALRPIIRLGFQVIPGLASLSPQFSRLREKVDR